MLPTSPSTFSTPFVVLEHLPGDRACECALHVGIHSFSRRRNRAPRGSPPALNLSRRETRGKISQLRRMFSPRRPGIPSKLLAAASRDRACKRHAHFQMSLRAGIVRRLDLIDAQLPACPRALCTASPRGRRRHHPPRFEFHKCRQYFIRTHKSNRRKNLPNYAAWEIHPVMKL